MWNPGSFLDDLDRICQADFAPTQQDVLHTRVATMGIIEVGSSTTKFPSGAWQTYVGR